MTGATTRKKVFEPARLADLADRLTRIEDRLAKLEQAVKPRGKRA
jgi:hypothetical protein